jgi:hypothetical protein
VYSSRKHLSSSVEQQHQHDQQQQREKEGNSDQQQQQQQGGKNENSDNRFSQHGNSARSSAANQAATPAYQLQQERVPLNSSESVVENRGLFTDHNLSKHHHQYQSDKRGGKAEEEEVFGVQSKQVADRELRSSRKQFVPLSDPDGGYQGVMESFAKITTSDENFNNNINRDRDDPFQLNNAYSAGQNYKMNQRGEQEQTHLGRGGGGGGGGGDRSRSNSPSKAPTAVAGHATRKVLTPSKKKSPSGKHKAANLYEVDNNSKSSGNGSNNPGGLIKGKISVPFATDHTTAKVRDSLDVDEGKLMKLGIEETLLIAESDKLGRSKKSARLLSRVEEIESKLVTIGKSKSVLKKDIRKKNAELGLA